MSDIWLPRLIVIGLITALLAVIALVALDSAAPQWTGYIVTSIVSGLLGYVVSPGQKPLEK